MSSAEAHRSLVEMTSPYSFEDTVDRLTKAIPRAGLVLITRLDHAAGARSMGLELPASLVLVYGHPKGGTPIMNAYPSAALDLPLRVLVRHDSAAGGTVVAFHPVVEMLAGHGVPEALARRLEPAQALIRDALAA